MEQNLATFFEQDYPDFELLFCARHDGDEGLQLARRTGERYPQVRARYVTCGEPTPRFHNAKVYSLERLDSIAHYDEYVTSDADVRVAPDYLRRMVRYLEDPDVGLASCLYLGTAHPGAGLSSQLDAVGKSVEMSSGVLVADLMEGTKFALGATMAVRRRSFQQAGSLDGAGLPVLAQFSESATMDAEYATVAPLGAPRQRPHLFGPVWVAWPVLGCRYRSSVPRGALAAGNACEPMGAGSCGSNRTRRAALAEGDTFVSPAGSAWGLVVDQQLPGRELLLPWNGVQAEGGWPGRIRGRAHRDKLGRHRLTIREECFSSAGGQEVHRAEGTERANLFGKIVGEEKQAAWPRPHPVEAAFIQKDIGRIRPKAAEPRTVDAAMYQQDLLPGIEEQGGTGGKLAIDHNAIAWPALLIDGLRQLF